jgi:Family of unknown function (DUF5519)
MEVGIVKADCKSLQKLKASAQSEFNREIMVVSDAQKRIVAEVSKWEGVESSAHRFGGTEFRLGQRELGHIHGDHFADIVFPMTVRNRLIAEGKAEPHHILSSSGWVTFRFRDEQDVGRALELFRISYEEALKRSPMAPADQ